MYGDIADHSTLTLFISPPPSHHRVTHTTYTIILTMPPSLPAYHYYAPSPSPPSHHISPPLHHHTPATGLSDAPVGLPPPSLSQVPSAVAGSSLMMEDSHPHHLQNVTIYAADTVSQGVPSVVKQGVTFDGVEGGASGVGVARANGPLCVNETLVPCPRGEVVLLSRSKNSWTTCLGPLILSLSHNTGPQVHPPSPYITLRVSFSPLFSAQ